MPVDFSPYSQPIPESPTSRGLRGIGDAVDAVMARRQAMEQARLQREQAHLHARMLDDRQRDATKIQAENIQENRKLRESMFARTDADRDRAFAETQRQNQAKIKTWIPQVAQLPGGEALAAMLAKDVGIDWAPGGQAAAAGTGGTAAAQPATPENAAAPAVAPTPQPGASAPPSTPPPGGAPGQVQPPAVQTPPVDIPSAVAARPATPAPLPSPSPPSMGVPSVGLTLPGALAGLSSQNRSEAFRRDYTNLDPDLQPFVEQGAALVRGGATAADAYAKTIGAELARRAAAQNARLANERKTETLSAGEAARLSAANRRDLDDDIKEWKREQRFTENVTALQEMNKSMSALTSGNSVAQTGARYGIGRTIAGPGVFTEGEQQTILGRVGGAFEGWAQMVQTWMDGKLNPSQRKIFEDYVKGKWKYLKTQWAPQAAQGFRDSYLDPDSGFAEHKNVAINRYNRIFAPFGIPKLDKDGNEMAPAGRAPAAGKPAAPLPDKATRDAEAERLERELGLRP